MIRTDSAGTYGFLARLTATDSNFFYCVGFPINDAIADVLLIPKQAWTGAQDRAVLNATAARLVKSPACWISRPDRRGCGSSSARKSRKSGRSRGSSTSTAPSHGHREEPDRGQLAVLEVRHGLRACCEDRIRFALDSGFANLAFKSFAANEL